MVKHPKSQWKCFLHITNQPSDFRGVYLVKRGRDAKGRFSLVWVQSESRWVEGGELNRARVRAGEPVLAWVAEQVKRALGEPGGEAFL